MPAAAAPVVEGIERLVELDPARLVELEERDAEVPVGEPVEGAGDHRGAGLLDDLAQGHAAQRLAGTLGQLRPFGGGQLGAAQGPVEVLERSALLDGLDQLDAAELGEDLHVVAHDGERLAELVRKRLRACHALVELVEDAQPHRVRQRLRDVRCTRVVVLLGGRRLSAHRAELTLGGVRNAVGRSAVVFACPHSAKAATRSAFAEFYDAYTAHPGYAGWVQGLLELGSRRSRRPGAGPRSRLRHGQQHRAVAGARLRGHRLRRGAPHARSRA